jgi:pSer/pThr/pTyr-binding forkhead associated (FHA) protein
MEDERGLAEGHPLQGPHRALHPETPEGFRPLLLVLEPIGLRIEVQQPHVVVGRHSEAEIRLASPDISRRHCRLVFENQLWRVIDLDSLNGVFVNGERMHEATLYQGDHLQIGKLTFLVEHTVAAEGEGLKKEVLQSIVEAMKEQKLAS